MMKLLTTAVLLAVLSTVGQSLAAHHGRGSTYDMNTRITLKGVVSRVDWRNPHGVIYKRVPKERMTDFGWEGLFAGVTEGICAPMNEVEGYTTRASATRDRQGLRSSVPC